VGLGESCFGIKVYKDERRKTGYREECSFQISLHKKDLPLLILIQTSFNGVGNFTKQGKDLIQYQVSSIKDLAVIINHFDKYPLITQKKADYELLTNPTRAHYARTQSLWVYKVDENGGLTLIPNNQKSCS
jgi:hypothetical protein